MVVQRCSSQQRRKLPKLYGLPEFETRALSSVWSELLPFKYPGLSAVAPNVGGGAKLVLLSALHSDVGRIVRMVIASLPPRPSHTLPRWHSVLC